MPNIGNLVDVQYSALDPYYYQVDNRPLATMFSKLQLVNSATDANIAELLSAAGDAGTLTARLAVSLDSTGNFSSAAIDATMHSIAAHTDADGFVRMTEDERTKLASTAVDANFIQFHFTTISTSPFSDVTFDNGTVNIEPSSTVKWVVEGTVGDQIVKAEMNLPPELTHIHIYDDIPEHYDVYYPDWKTFRVPRTFLDTTLRVYINGIKLSESSNVYVPQYGGIGTWRIISFTYDVDTLIFTLSQSITASDILRIDFDIPSS